MPTDRHVVDFQLGKVLCVWICSASSTLLFVTPCTFLPQGETFPTPYLMCCAGLSRSVVSSSLQPHEEPVRLLCPWGFSRQEYWSGLPPYPILGLKFSSYMCLWLICISLVAGCHMCLFFLSFKIQPTINIVSSLSHYSFFSWLGSCKSPQLLWVSGKHLSFHTLFCEMDITMANPWGLNNADQPALQPVLPGL